MINKKMRKCILKKSDNFINYRNIDVVVVLNDMLRDEWNKSLQDRSSVDGFKIEVLKKVVNGSNHRR